VPQCEIAYRIDRIDRISDERLIGLIGYPMNHPVKPVIQTDESESGQTSDGSPDDRIDRFRSIPLTTTRKGSRIQKKYKESRRNETTIGGRKCSASNL